MQAAVTEARARLSALQDKVDAAEAACKESKATMARVQEAQKQVSSVAPCCTWAVAFDLQQEVPAEHGAGTVGSV